ncbi:radical SAM protein with 4Fe4S-binding SPASM domain [Mesorhizobium sp. USDA 4775]|uniref:Radical SAM additional 4Fe4S-binding SPASM domain-containing protein n=1 Tax=Mesorhizobium qingshengii TaxID=1165689 RepID=A0A1G5ZYF1_9HYPH|nr:radical SAM protein [Mesorhizobium jarvisii]AID34836.1 radical SAM protein [Mesorhizobium huakuii 7653R]MCH4561000.1 radical SAM protein [Mesorhizobium jarvisii]SDA99273.1 radical SAM additional 4Fe4S-binding SPASM domain-containing protein [Mesorhizobium qingshengii]
MLQHMAPLAHGHRAELPDKTRPLVRWRREAFGLLAAFPDGHVAVLDAEAAPLLEAGADYASCSGYRLPRLEVATDFHFSAPLMAWLELTRACNLRCPHCFVEGGVARAGEMRTDRILALLDEWARMGVFSVILTGGEPTMHRNFLEIVRHAHSLGFVVGIATNGMPITERMLSTIPRDDVIISVSIDHLHGQGARKGLSDFEYAKGKLLMMKQAGFNTSIMTTTSSQNVHQLQDIIDWAIENDLSLRSVPFVEMGRGKLHGHLLNQSQDVEAAARFWMTEEEWERVRDPKLGLCAGKVFNFLLTMVYATRRCMSGRGIAYVNSNGDVYPCSTCSGNKVLCAGNVAWSDFAEIWEGKWDIRAITWDTFESTCKGCAVADRKYFCTGRCPGSSSVRHGRLDGCGSTDFQKASILRREELFKASINAEPAVPVHAPHTVSDPPVSA